MTDCETQKRKFLPREVHFQYNMVRCPIVNNTPCGLGLNWLLSRLCIHSRRMIEEGETFLSCRVFHHGSLINL